MKSLISLASFAFLFSFCSQGQNEKNNLSAVDFNSKILAIPEAPILDVRTPEEFEKGHIAKALNYDWNGNRFESQIENLDKTKPVFVYCLSGGRSSSAAKKMRSLGFNTVYELDGGIMKWRAANLPEVKGSQNSNQGMSKQQYEVLLNTNKTVLVDFYADWCVPCKKMKPYLDEMAKNLADKVEIIRIDADNNQALCKELNIDALPVLLIYKNKTLTWTHIGFIEKEEVIKKLNE